MIWFGKSFIKFCKSFMNLMKLVSTRTCSSARVRAELNKEFAIYASHRRLQAWPGDGGRGGRRPRSWTGSLLFTQLAADFGPGPDAAEEGGGAGRGVCSLRLTPPTSGLSRRRRWRGAELDGPGGVCSLYLEPPSFFFNPASSTGATKQVWLTRRRPSESPPIRRRGSGLQS